MTDKLNVVEKTERDLGVMIQSMLKCEEKCTEAVIKRTLCV